MRIVDAEGLKEIICDITNYAIEHNQTKSTIQKRLILAVETLPTVPTVKDKRLECLTGRPCDVCKFHTENGCKRWTCIFEEEFNNTRKDNEVSE